MATAKTKLKRAPAKATTKVSAKAPPASEGDLLEIGAKVIYGFKSDPGKNAWEKAAGETRASYRARMQELLNELAAEGYVVRR
jgi:hypothetical protein